MSIKIPREDGSVTTYRNSWCMEKFMKFPLYEKENKDEKYRLDPFRAVNFRTNETGDLLCPNDRKILFKWFPSPFVPSNLVLYRGLDLSGDFSIEGSITQNHQSGEAPAIGNIQELFYFRRFILHRDMDH